MTHHSQQCTMCTVLMSQKKPQHSVTITTAFSDYKLTLAFFLYNTPSNMLKYHAALVPDIIHDHWKLIKSRQTVVT